MVCPMLVLRLIVPISIACLLSTTPAHACSCGVQPTCGSFWSADAVFIARAAVTPLGATAQHVRFTVTEWFRGAKQETVEITPLGLGGSCDARFEDGGTYLVYAHRDPERGFAVSLCSRTAHVEKAGEDIARARAISSGQLRTGRVSGATYVGERLPSGALRSALPLTGVRLSLTGPNGVVRTESDLRGQFVFEEVPPGEYVLAAHHPPNLEAAKPQTVVVPGPGACVGASFTTTRR